MATKRWSDLSERDRRVIVVGGVVDGVLRVAALVDLKRRPAEEVRGPKGAWATAIALVSSMGVVPVAYFRCGVRRPRSS